MKTINEILFNIAVIILLLFTTNEYFEYCVSRACPIPISISIGFVLLICYLAYFKFITKQLTNLFTNKKQKP